MEKIEQDRRSDNTLESRTNNLTDEDWDGVITLGGILYVGWCYIWIEY